MGPAADGRGPRRGTTLTVAWYHFRATFRQAWAVDPSIVLLVGLVGGVAMGSIAGARRTQSTFPAYLTATRASDLQLQTSTITNEFGTDPVIERLARLPHVQHVADAPYLLVIPQRSQREGHPFRVQRQRRGGGRQRRRHVLQPGPGDGRPGTDGRSGEYARTVADPPKPPSSRAGISATSPSVRTRRASQHSQLQPADPGAAVPVSAKLVGIVAFSSQVVDDDVDRFPDHRAHDPGPHQGPEGERAPYPTYGLRLDTGNLAVPSVEREIVDALPPDSTYNFHLTSVVEGQVERATEPEAIALGVFGAIVGVAAVLIGAQAISRRLWANRRDLDVLRSLGADSPTMAADAMLGPLCA